LALSLTPRAPRCSNRLKLVTSTHERRAFGWFNRGFTRTAKGYEFWPG
jgi:multidrug efflux pump